MNAHVGGTAAIEHAVAVSHEPILEERICDLARLARATRIVFDAVMDGLRSYASSIPEVAQVMDMTKEDREVLLDMIQRMEIEARDLRVAFYRQAHAA